MLKTDGFGALLEVEMLKKCTPLWRESHFEIKMVKTLHVGPFLDVEPSFCVAGAKRKQNVKVL